MAGTTRQANALLTQDEITVISLDVVRQYSKALDFVGVMASEGGSGRVEIMVTIQGCHEQPCQLILNLSRADRVALQDELRQKLEAALRTHGIPQ
jgi:hypothetical protein